ncbi:MAG: 2-hydroxymuconate tautomerase family protein [Sphingopyxis sp.]|nr:2-hydroxymuconate tautomerase family protein [Sphingopyxis sp.]
MPIITASILAGRTADQKRALIRELAEGAQRALGVREEQVRVIITEVPPEHWGVGTKSKADLEGQA